MTDSDRIASLTVIVTDLTAIFRDLLGDIRVSDPAHGRLSRSLTQIEARIESLSVLPTPIDRYGDWRGRERARLDSIDPVRQNRHKAKA